MIDDEADPDEGGGEPVVRCPIYGGTAEQPSRGLHLHVLRSSGSGHGEQGDIPPGVSLDDAEVVGQQEVEVDYPEERKTESAARLCPYCERPYKGKNGVLIHLGLVEGRKDHPENASEVHDPTDFPVVEIDEDENVVAVVNSPEPSAVDQRRQYSDEGVATNDEEVVLKLNREEVEHLYDAIQQAGLEDERAGLILRRPPV
jgi:hypothetical protein